MKTITVIIISILILGISATGFYIVNSKTNLNLGETIHTFAQNYWNRVGTTISPKTANDSLNIGTGSYYGDGSHLTGISAGITYPSGSGIAIVSGGNSWGTTITDSSSNWNSAYTATQNYLDQAVKQASSPTFSALTLGATGVATGQLTLAGTTSGTSTIATTATGGDIVLTPGTTGDATVLSDSGSVILGSNKGAGYNESLRFDFETTENTIGVSSATGVTGINFGSLNLTTAGILTLGNSTTGTLVTRIKAGAPTESDANGALVVDSSNARLYFKYGNAWHYINQSDSASLPPIYANNAAAIAGGLVSGQNYRSGGDPDILYIVH